MRVIAIDLGASSVRVAAIDLDRAPFEVEIVHRWPHAPVEHTDGTLRWDWAGIVTEVRRGLDRALDVAPADSIGVDGWGVDYGLLGPDGQLVTPPYSYRDRRTGGWQHVADRIGWRELYETTGIQLMPINTIFQLASHDRGELEAAERLLLLPDLLVHELTGYVGAERSNASTTALLDVRTGEWAQALVDAIEVPPRLLAPIRTATEPVGSYQTVPVHLVGSHDTASAFAAAPGVPGPGTALVASGTWFLVGAERDAPDLSDEARRANFSNELGATGGVRFLKNVTGLWMLEQCRVGWGHPPIEGLLAAAEAVDGPVPVVDTADARFLSPADMEAEVRAAAGLAPSAPRGVVVRCVLESIAQTTAGVVAELAQFAARPVDEVFVLGGGSRMQLMHRLLEQRTGVPVRVGTAEAAALGNALVQGIALGRFADLAEARAALSAGDGGSVDTDDPPRAEE